MHWQKKISQIGFLTDWGYSSSSFKMISFFLFFCFSITRVVCQRHSWYLKTLFPSLDQCKILKAGPGLKWMESDSLGEEMVCMLSKILFWINGDYGFIQLLLQKPKAVKLTFGLQLRLLENLQSLMNYFLFCQQTAFHSCSRSWLWRTSKPITV